MGRYLEYPHIWFFLRWYNKMRTWHDGCAYIMAEDVMPEVDFDHCFVKPYLLSNINGQKHVTFYDHPTPSAMTAEDLDFIENLEWNNGWISTTLHHAVSSFDDHEYIITRYRSLMGYDDKLHYGVYSRLNGALCRLSCPNVKGKVVRYDKYFTIIGDICTLSKVSGRLGCSLQLTLFDAIGA